MAGFETSLGGAPEFRTTIWSDILAAGNPSHPQMRQRLDTLLRRYWKPVYTYIRMSWNASVDDAKDLTQAFFTRMLEKEYWSNLRPEKGSFRGYLKQALKHFLINAREHEAVRKPVGGVLFSLDAPAEELARIAPAASDESAEDAYDRVWFRCVMENATTALREALDREGKKIYFEVFSAYCFGNDGMMSVDERATVPGEAPAQGPTHHDLAERFGLKETDVHNYLTYCRQRLRQIVHDSIRDYVTSAEDLERELREAAGG